MTDDSPLRTKQRPFWLLLVISFTLFVLSVVLDVALRWPDQTVIFAVIYGIIWGVVLLPWSLAVCGLYRWRRWQRLRAFWVLLPAVAVCLTLLLNLVRNPPIADTPETRFARTVHVSFPKNYSNLKIRFRGGGLEDYHDVYFFDTAPDEVDRLIQEMGLTKDDAFGFEGHFSMKPLDGFSDFREWKGAERYSHYEDFGWYYDLVVNGTKTKVYFVAGNL